MLPRSYRTRIDAEAVEVRRIGLKYGAREIS